MAAAGVTSGSFGVYATETLAATGTTQGNATASALVPGQSACMNITGADGTVGAKLPLSVAGTILFIKNGTNGTLKLYPGVGDGINAIAANTEISFGALKSAVFVCTVAGTWMTHPLLPS